MPTIHSVNRLLSLITLTAGILVGNLSSQPMATGQEPATEEASIFSGPQVGEELAPFEFVGAFDDQAGKRFDPIAQTEGKPVVIVFVHQANRPSIAMTRMLMTYIGDRPEKNVEGFVVWLTADPTQAENDLKRMRHALPPKTMIGIYPDGVEGPGTYGLNRQVTLTVLIGKENKVTANYALVQPSIQVDLPKIMQSIVDMAGGEVADIAKLSPPAMRPNANNNRSAPAVPEALTNQLRTYLRPMIQKDATDEQVDKSAAAIEEWIEKDEAARKEIARISKTIVNSDKLENYGTARTQMVLRRWAEKYNPPSDKSSQPQ